MSKQVAEPIRFKEIADNISTSADGRREADRRNSESRKTAADLFRRRAE